MDTMEAIFTRRSIRKYTKQEVSDELLKELLEAAMCAPSASNCQPWCFVVIKDHKVMDEIPRYHPYSGMLPEASVAVVVCCDLRQQQTIGYGVEDCSAATQNLLLAAHAKGLGTVWLGVYPNESRVNGTKNLLNLPEYILPVALISIGYPAEQRPRQERYMDEKVHYNQW
ncbi:MAG: nitroreductase family protein [Dehalococcoidales bacterium]|nr:nitroreductase family protein [Dehalococcoidales bacterium]